MPLSILLALIYFLLASIISKDFKGIVIITFFTVIIAPLVITYYIIYMLFDILKTWIEAIFYPFVFIFENLKNYFK